MEMMMFAGVLSSTAQFCGWKGLSRALLMKGKKQETRQEEIGH